MSIAEVPVLGSPINIESGMSLYFLVTGAVLLSVIYFAIKANKARQLKYIEQYHFHKGIRHKLSQKHPQLTEPQLDMVFQGLKDYFRICHRAKNAWCRCRLKSSMMPGMSLFFPPVFMKNSVTRRWGVFCITRPPSYVCADSSERRN